MAGGKEGGLASVTTTLSGRRSNRCMEGQYDKRKKTRIPRSRGERRILPNKRNRIRRAWLERDQKH
jgi:hypothetical protein